MPKYNNAFPFLNEDDKYLGTFTLHNTVGEVVDLYELQSGNFLVRYGNGSYDCKWYSFDEIKKAIATDRKLMKDILFPDAFVEAYKRSSVRTYDIPCWCPCGCGWKHDEFGEGEGTTFEKNGLCTDCHKGNHEIPPDGVNPSLEDLIRQTESYLAQMYQVRTQKDNREYYIKLIAKNYRYRLDQTLQICDKIIALENDPHYDNCSKRDKCKSLGKQINMDMDTSDPNASCADDVSLFVSTIKTFREFLKEYMETHSNK
jgi:hypothetical protein